MVDGTSGDSNITNIFQRKYKSLFNSVESSDEDLSQRIQSAVTAECECTIKSYDESNHCHEICRTDVQYVSIRHLRTRGFIYLSLSLVNNKTKLTLSKAIVQSSVHMYKAKI